MKALQSLLVSTCVLLVSVSGLLSISCMSENGAENAAFLKTFQLGQNSFGNDVLQASDGGYVFCGHYRTADKTQLALIKTDQEGDELWSAAHDWDADVAGYAVNLTKDSGYIVCGSIKDPDYTDFGNRRIILIKFNSAGQMIWSQIQDSAFVSEAYDVQQTSDGGFITCGYRGKYGYLLKTDSEGNKQWDNKFSSGYRIIFQSLDMTRDGGFIFAGTLEQSSAIHYVYVLKTDRDGTELWSNTYGRAARGYSIQHTTDNGYIVSGSNSGQLYLLKLDETGHEIWSNSFQEGAYSIIGFSCQQTRDGGYVVCGQNRLNAFIYKTDESGRQEWFRNIDDFLASATTSIQQTSDSGYILCGGASNYTEGSNVLLIKTTSFGHY